MKPRTPRVPCSLGLGSTLCVSEAVSEAGGGSLCARELQFVRIMCTQSDRGTVVRAPCTAPGGPLLAVCGLWLFVCSYFVHVTNPSSVFITPASSGHLRALFSLLAH